MRISSGKYKKKPIQGPPESAMTRPLPSVVKEAMFNLLRGHWEGARVLDGFAGTGSFGLEAVSQGAEEVVFIEKDKNVVRVLERNIDSLGAMDQCDVVCGDALGPVVIARCPKPVDIVFFDPPYPMVRSPEDWARIRVAFGRLVDCLADTGFAILRTPSPLYHVVECEPEEGQDLSASVRNNGAEGFDPKAEQRDEDMNDFEDPDVEDDIVIGGERMVAFDPEDEAEMTGKGAPKARKPKVPVKRVDVPLTFDNADGPETHVYRHTALHLYMKKGFG